MPVVNIKISQHDHLRRFMICYNCIYRLIEIIEKSLDKRQVAEFGRQTNFVEEMKVTVNQIRSDLIDSKQESGARSLDFMNDF